ncbi:VCBS repeat-containing protein [Paenibacillus sp. GP183]|uniref:FG-GAP repeat domain-containing protein n=1 Tax=Paenibacillus sp. GP183 TaxID=1882751 RepID=UPI000B851CAC|nr:VCBS repeat-containing protein [Paenibacillus sp. GP183]
MSKFKLRNAGIAALILLIAALSLLFVIQKEDTVKLLYATGGEAYDSSAFGDFEQSLQANLRLERKNLHTLSKRELEAYDSIYLDPELKQSATFKEDIPKLESFVRHGGHLFLENGFAPDFKAEFLGAQQVVKIPAVTRGVPAFTFPDADVNMGGMQQVFRLFTESFFKRTAMEELPGFDWGYGLVPSTAKTLVGINQLSLISLNQIGSGTVVLGSTFMPNRYFVTGYDLQSGMDPAQGFPKFAEKYNQTSPNIPGTAYFNKRALPLEPYFDFGFAAANTEFRNAYIGFVSKQKLGYSIKKVLGPNGRPAMAYQNHFEAMPAIGQKDGIQWAELLKKYNEIPSFTLIRSSFNWGQWRESLTTQLNVGTNAQPQFVGELPGSGYSGGLHLLSGGSPLRLALFPQYRDLASAIELPYRAYPALADLDGDGRLDLLAGSADGFVYAYTNLGPNPAAYSASEPLPQGAAPPDTFGEARKLQLESGTPLKLQPYAAIHAADVNGDGLPDLVVADESGVVRLLPGRGGGKFGPPAALSAGGKPLQVQGPAAVDVADVNGDGVRDLVVGDGDGRVILFAGIRGSGDFEPGQLLFQLPDSRKHAAPAVRDMNGDGRPDLVVGSNEGDLLLYLQEADGSWKNQGPLEGATLNQVGNKALVAGHNSVPLWYDINHDGKDDLIVGAVEFGSPVAIDDPKFPYKTELKEFITYAHDHFLKLDPHLFVHNFKSDAQEREEIALHKKAFDTLGIPWNNPGTNQHTWRVNYPDRMQTLRDESEQGIWFNFGFFPAHSPVVSRPVSIWSLPFILQNKDSKPGSLMLLHTPTPVLNVNTFPSTDIFDGMAKLDMPIDYFEHIEYHFPIPAKIADLTEFASYFDKLRNEQDYNFVTEDQMAQSFLTAIKGEVTVSHSWGSYLWDKLKNRLVRGNPHWSVDITPNLSHIPKQAEEYAGTLGVVIEKGIKYYDYSLSTNSDVYLQREGSFYLGLSKPVHVHIGPSGNRLHVVRVNVPFQIHQENNMQRIDLQAAGMQQVKIFSPEAIRIEGSDLKIEAQPDNHTYTVTHYGDKTSITISPAGT